MKKWRVYFERKLRSYIDAEARTEESAILKAKREWQEKNQPLVTDVEERKP